MQTYVLDQQSPLRIGIQGGIGSFHHQAVNHYFKSSTHQIVPFDSFPELFGAMEDNAIDFAAVAMENSIAGFIHPNYKLLEYSKATIVGELYLPVEHCLLLGMDTEIENIREIQSHPMAILQCLDYLHSYRQKGIKLVESIDTALSAKYIAEHKAKHVAVIASKEAANIYGLKIQQKNIESSTDNFTRFIFLQKKNKTEHDNQSMVSGKQMKATISLILENISNELPEILKIISDAQCKIKVMLQLMDNSGNHKMKFLLEFITLIGQDTSAVIKSIEQLGIKVKNIGIYESN